MNTLTRTEDNLSKSHHTKEYNAVIVLANLMDAQGNLNEESRARMDTAINAFLNNEAPFLVTCGWAYRADSLISVADAMSAYAVNCGIPFDSIITDRDSRDTVGDAFFTKRNHAVTNRWTSILVITSRYHVERTKQIFSLIYGSQYLIEVRGAPSIDTDQLHTSELQSIETFKSTFQGITPGDDEAILTRLRERHPFYNGLIYPKI